jgi:hypothetical protein
MPVLDGVSAIRLLAERGVTARVLVLTTFDTDTVRKPSTWAVTSFWQRYRPTSTLARNERGYWNYRDPWD